MNQQLQDTCSITRRHFFKTTGLGLGAMALDMLGVEAVTEGMSDQLVGHHPTVPGISKTVQAVVATRRFEDGLHTSMMQKCRSSRTRLL